MDVSIIIVNYNTIPLLVNTIDSIFALTEGIKYEIIVVDNNSTDNSKVILKEKYGEKVIYMALPENFGFGRANNEAAKIAKGRNLFFLNPDTVLLNNAVKILSDYLDNNADVGCCGGNLMDIERNPTHSFRRCMPASIFAEINRFILGIPEKILYGENFFYNYTNKPMEVGYITGADLMFRTELFKKLGGFDPDFFMYFEESELEYRVKRAGFSITSVPFARIIHLEGKSFLNNIIKLKKIYVSRLIFIRKVHSPIIAIIINTIFFFTVISHLFLYIIIQNKEKANLWREVYKITFLRSVS